jgi:glutamyl-Q tRNA(Asp) synthetase
MNYCGRFAPSPTGPLHLGSLLSAVGSYLQARANKGQWLVRIEDLDPPREVHGAADLILQTLEQHGLTWDASVLYQSTRHRAYQEAIDQLFELDACYPCSCSRRSVELYQQQHKLHREPYPGICRHQILSESSPQAKIRVKIPSHPIKFNDPIQGEQQYDLSKTSGDFVVQRADGLFAYQLAVVVDDSYQHITEVVRGSDLLDSTPQQLVLQNYLSYDSLNYMHLPILVDQKGKKLSKQTFAQPLNLLEASYSLEWILQILGHPADSFMTGAPCRELLEWAISEWNPDKIPKQRLIVLTGETR